METTSVETHPLTPLWHHEILLKTRASQCSLGSEILCHLKQASMKKKTKMTMCISKLESGGLPSAGRALVRELRHLESLSGSILIFFKRLNVAHVISWLLHINPFSLCLVRISQPVTRWENSWRGSWTWNFLGLSVHLTIFSVICSNFWSALKSVIVTGHFQMKKNLFQLQLLWHLVHTWICRKNITHYMENNAREIMLDL